MGADGMASPEQRMVINPIIAPPRPREEVRAPVLPKPPLEKPTPPPEQKLPPEKKSWIKSRIARIGMSLLALGGLGSAGYAAYQNDMLPIHPIHQTAEENPAAVPPTSLNEGSLAPEESASWWQELPQEKIQELAKTPEIQILDDKEYTSNVSPALQEKAKLAGYEIIYQDDPNDTTGRTVVTKGRQLINEDLGFGLDGDGFNIRGIFKNWVPDPNDPNQQKQIYAILENPITNEKYTIAVELFPDTGGNERTTWFTVDDLNIGIDEINKRAQEQRGYKDSTFLLPDANAPIGTPHKKITDFPTVNDLVRKQGIKLTDLIAPGDYVAAILQTAGTPIDPNGIRKTILLTVRRFGGTTEWKKENGIY